MNTSSIKQTLGDEFPYYKKLSDNEKIRFENRVKAFIEEKTFEGRKNLEITDKIKILVSATAIQLTFGHDYFLFEHFKLIIIYPEKYHSQYDQTYHVGEANSRGVIVLSWKDFYAGIKVDFDGKNVGLHEFAHALLISEVTGKYVDDYFSDYLEKWLVAGEAYLRANKYTHKHFFRQYAVTNIHELFAVGVEYFFEKPNEFLLNEPDFYKIFSLTLRQDPRLKNNEFSYQLLFKEQSSEMIAIRKNVTRTNPKKNTPVKLFFSFFLIAFILIIPFPVWMKVISISALSYYIIQRVVNYTSHEKYVQLNAPVLIRKIYTTTSKISFMDLIISLDLYQSDEGADTLKIIYADFDRIESMTTEVTTDINVLFFYAYYYHNIATFKNGSRYFAPTLI
ncbi:MAG TPA: zinc-dependent peptidase [Cytophagaceae bacterium]|jgi:Mlc titration factor MtfA (ptsG expression regulator)|nr:zinc-dependent peptidase [Cytophagaceae bacterium]